MADENNSRKWASESGIDTLTLVERPGARYRQQLSDPLPEHRPYRPPPALEEDYARWCIEHANRYGGGYGNNTF
ncbi:hypothetical protein HOD05_02080 [Candidatus Woesearchaeota archaeon]|jgi:hypothetical protein|nr:hypothetical protein [Candidatus Woesearchaeota archaeon]MBT4151256.1 hypothetical protein [Candidatus Woesearchaeota archaeon]MBT4433984.1 hypothetical protein [Candidatus Woesearchaeota archaeon]MBT7332381.1 hypothetical protein [Candidatus Woesearchaeota archaeon]